MSDRFICNTSQPPVKSLRELATRSFCRGNGCIPNALEGSAGLCISTLCPGQKVPPEDSSGGEHGGLGRPNLGDSAMVSLSSAASDRLPVVVASSLRPSERSIREEASSSAPASVTVSHLESLRDQHLAAGFSERSSRLILTGWSKGTNTVYQSGWKRWHSWCYERKVNPFSCPIQDFLSKVGNIGQLIQSDQLSMPHSHIEGVHIGQHPLVTRLLKGIYNSRPPLPRYTDTWNVDVVLSYLVSLGENSQLSLKQLSQKLVILMAQVQASRSSELHALDVRFQVYKPDGVVFTLPTLTKKRKVSAPAKELFFGAYPADSQLCVTQCLHQYEQVTYSFHLKGKKVSNPLFLSYIKPHKPVSTDRIAHWMKDLLKKAGIDVSVFKAHSVRGASTTAARDKGVSIGDILRTADWSSDSTFRPFYCRPSGNTYSEVAV